MDSQSAECTHLGWQRHGGMLGLLMIDGRQCFIAPSRLPKVQRSVWSRKTKELKRYLEQNR